MRAACLILILAALAAAGPAPDSVAVLMARGHLQAARDESGRLAPGPRFTLGRISVSSGPGFTAERLGIAAYAGEAADAPHVEAIATRVRAWLLDHGHPFAVVSIDFAVRADAPVVDLQVAIEAGDGYKFGGFKATGSRTKPDVLDRLSLLDFGEDYGEERLRLALGKLGRTGYFENVARGPLFRDSTRNLLYPGLALSDLKGNRLGGILGYDSEQKGGDGLTGYLDIHLINLRGTARDLDFAFDSKQTPAGTPAKDARFAYTEPWILTTRVGARLDLAITNEDSVYDEWRADLTFFQDLDFHSRLLVAFGRQGNRDYAADTRTRAEIAGLGFQYDARDRVPSTLNGARYSLRLNALHRDAGDSSYFLVQTVDDLALWFNTGRWVFHTLISTGGDWPLDRRPDRGEMFALGGANTIRGFREREFLTNLYGYANLEVQFLLAPGSRASVFAVPALINRAGTDVTWRREIGYGAGLESGSRDWTFGISYALNPDREPGDGFVHLRVTNNF